jgi:hypothetical protein
VSPLRLTDHNRRAYRRERSEETSNKSSQDKMDSYPSRATVVGMPTCRAFNRCQQIVLGDLCRMKEDRA